MDDVDVDIDIDIDSTKLENGCRMIHAGVPSFFGLGLKLSGFYYVQTQGSYLMVCYIGSLKGVSKSVQLLFNFMVQRHGKPAAGSYILVEKVQDENPAFWLKRPKIWNLHSGSKVPHLAQAAWPKQGSLGLEGLESLSLCHSN